MYETLYARDENAGVVPDLAQGAEISKDGLTYVFTLRPGVKFHNGKIMDAGDVVASLERFRKIGLAIDPAERRRYDRGIRSARSDREAEEGAVEFPRYAVLAGHAAGDLSGRGGGEGPEGLQVHRHRADEVRRIRAGQPRHAGAVRRLRAEPQLHQARRVRRPQGDVHRPRDVPLHAGVRRAHRRDPDRRSADQRNHRRPDREAACRRPQRAGAEAAAVRAADRQVQPCAGALRRREFPPRGAGVPQHAEETMAIAYPDIYKLDGGLLYGYSPYYSKAGTELYNHEQPGQGEGVAGEEQVQGRDADLHHRQHPSPTWIPRPTSRSSLARSASRST